MPETPSWLSTNDVLTYEEILRIISICAKMGVEKIRLSGGEPLVRRNLDRLVRMLKGVSGIRFIGMTTNGLLFHHNAAALKEAGLNGVTISLHTLKPDRFKGITGGGRLEGALEAVETAKAYGFNPVKINSLIIRGFNDDEITDLASLAFDSDVTVRFIEFMPFDGQRNWGMDKVVGGDEIIETVRKRYKLLPLPREQSSTARVYRMIEGRGEIGIITSVTEPFCSDCDRIRLTAGGKIFACLFDRSNYELKSLLREGASDEELANVIRTAVSKKAPGVQTLLKECHTLEHVRPMHTIGG